tara:strand:- start:3525 stop:3860 length:336 start_codon:yes stop_codon:yes gene_type:complete
MSKNLWLYLLISAISAAAGATLKSCISETYAHTGPEVVHPWLDIYFTGSYTATLWYKNPNQQGYTATPPIQHQIDPNNPIIVQYMKNGNIRILEFEVKRVNFVTFAQGQPQ